MIKKLLQLALLGLFVFQPVHGKLKESDKQFLNQPETLLVNPGAENGTQAWTATGAGSLSASTTDPLEGKQSLLWDPSASGEFLDSGSLTIKEGMKGQLCEASAQVSWNAGVDGDIKLQLRDSTNTLQEVNLPVTTSNQPGRIIRALATCPTSGFLQWRLESFANAAVVKIDRIHLGRSLIEVEIASAEIAVDMVYPATASCVWSRTNTVVGAFTAAAACPAPTVVTSASGAVVDLSDDDLPTFVFTNLPVGRYVAQVILSARSTAALAESSFVLRNVTDATDLDSRSTGDIASADETHSLSLAGTFTKTVAGAHSLAIFGSASTGFVAIDNDTASGFQPSTRLILTRYPLDSEKAVLLSEANGWYIDANIGGANPNLGTASVATYTGIEDAALDIVQNTGSAPVQIGCSSTNGPGTGTCSVGNESVSVAFTPPFAGTYRACATLGWANSVAASGNVNVAFQLVETPINAQTITNLGKAIGFANNAEDGASAQNTGDSFTVCGIFTFNSVSQKMIRLFYEQLVAGVVTSSILTADRSATIGQRDVHWYVTPITQNFPMPVILNTVVTSDPRQLNFNSVSLDLRSGTPVIVKEYGSWVSSLTDLGVGAIRINPNAGTFGDDPVCTCTVEDNLTNRNCLFGENLVLSTGITFNLVDLVPANTDDGDVHIQCIAIK